MLKATLIDFDIHLWPLLGCHIVLPTLTMDAPDVALERDAQGNSNWDFEQNPVSATALSAIKPTQRSEAPIIGRFKVSNGHVTYTDPARRLELKGTLQTAIGKAPGIDQSELALSGCRDLVRKATFE